MLQAKDYLDALGDAKVREALAKQLRALPEEERLRFIEELLSSPHAPGRPASLWLGLHFAKRCLGDPRSLEAVLKQGLLGARGYLIDWYLEAVLPRIGYRRTMRVLQDVLASAPQAKENLWWALYYVGGVAERLGIQADSAYDMTAPQRAEIEAARVERIVGRQGDLEQRQRGE